MPAWVQYLIGAAVLIALAPLIAWLGRRYGRQARAGLALGGLLLGLGEVVDPPSKHLTEAGGPEEKESPTPGDPPTVGGRETEG
jgi:hypothetical protein